MNISAALPASLASRPRLRAITLFCLYFAQGLPEGLLFVAVPAWLATNGASAAEIGSFVAIILLPWSGKLVNGVIMDRFQYRAMGRRRPWIIGAQLMLVLVLCVLALRSPDAANISELAVLGFLVNLAAAFQDVAIDGLAIDIVPEAERGFANGVMWGGKTIGIALSTLVAGLLMAEAGLAVAALAVAGAIALVLLLPLALTERPGEKRWPWGQGRAVAGIPTVRRLGEIALELWRAMFRWTNFWFGGGILAAFAAYGLKTAFVPSLAVKQLAMSQGDFARLASGADLVGGLCGLLFAGWIADRIGHKWALMLALAGLMLLHLGMALTPEDVWAMPGLFPAWFVAHAVLFVMLSVAVYAAAMDRSVPTIGATHFAAYMAILNLGTAAGAQMLGSLQFGPQLFWAAGGCCALGLMLFAIGFQLDEARDQRV